MRRDGAIIELLNEVLTAELTSINQYFVDAKMLANWGYEPLAKHYYDESIDEMKDADVLIERILFLDGVPNLQRLSTVRGAMTMRGESAGLSQRSTASRSDWASARQPAVGPLTATCRKMPLPRAGFAGTTGML